MIQTRAPLRIEAADLRLVRLPLVTPFTISTGTMTEKIFPLLVLKADGIEGYAEGVMDPLPDYLEETVAGAMGLLRDVLLPQIIGQSFAHPQELARKLVPWRANHMAKATLEMAFWDLWAKSLNLPLQSVLGGSGDAIDVGVSLGIGPIDSTMQRIASHLEQGYKRIKLKVKPGHDLDLLRAARAEFPAAHLTVDANSCYTLADTALLQQMDAFDLECNNASIPYGWRWLPGASSDLAGMTLADALSLSLVEDMVKPLLPVSMLQGLECRFAQARKKINDLAVENPKARWIDKVRFIQPTQPLLVPQINPIILDTIQECLLADEIVDVEYRGAGAETAHSQRLQPLGLVTRGQITYLVATAWDYSDIRLYTLHRIAQANRTYEHCKKPTGFNLMKYLENGTIHSFRQRENHSSEGQGVRFSCENFA